MTSRRFPPPWAMIELPGGYAVQDATGTTLAYVYASDRQTVAGGALTPDEARRIAHGIARLPELLAGPKPRA